jgi:endogenous inhibitor of DNA gyrase (YacG/DUF329 family)
MRCPVCREPVSPPPDNRAFPFCATRCRQVDLGRWLTGQYTVDPESGALDLVTPSEADEDTSTADAHLGDDSEPSWKH